MEQRKSKLKSDFRNDVWILGHQESCELAPDNAEKIDRTKGERLYTMHFFDLFVCPFESERHFLFGPTPRALQESILEAVFFF